MCRIRRTRFRRALLGFVAVAMLCPAGAFADDLTLTAGNPTSDGIPTTVNASGSTSSSQGGVSVLRNVDHGSGCPSTYSVAYGSDGSTLLGEHSITAPGAFSYDDANSGTQTAGTTYRLCGYLQTPNGTTIAATPPYTVPDNSPPPARPTVVTGDDTSGPSGNVVFGTVNPNGGGSSYRFDYGTTTAYGQTVDRGCCVTGTTPTQVSATLPAFPAGTTIHYRLVASNAGGTSLGGDRVFTTPGGTPTVGAISASEVGFEGFTLNGTYNPHGPFTAYFEYTFVPVNENTRQTAEVPSVPEQNQGSNNAISQRVPTGFLDFYVSTWPSFGEEDFYKTFPHVKASKVKYRLVVGDTRSEWQTVTAPRPTKPSTVVTRDTSARRGKKVLFRGTVDDHAQGYSFTAFEYGRTKAYGNLCPAFTSHRNPGTRHALPYSGPYKVVGACDVYLPAGTTVHYRLGARLSGRRVVYGADRKFTLPGKSPRPPRQRSSRR